jgi:3-hydroxyisobutyrate dehydrogenase-like beta-hydroxyacid dehydrogenase
VSVTQLGFVGLGIMGQAMAKNVLGEETLVVYNRSQAKTEPLFKLGARVAQTPREAAAGSQICFVMVSNDEALKAVALGDDGILAGIGTDAIVVDHSTVSPSLTRELGAMARTKGALWCDAPVTGGDVGAREATLTIMVGGESHAVNRIQPFLARMSTRVVHVGDLGQGQTMKVVSNLVGCLNLMAAAEGLRLALACDLPLEAILSVLPHGTAQSFELAKILDRHQRQDFQPGFSIANRLKDLVLAVDLAHSRGQRVPLADVAETLLEEHQEAGYADFDESSYLKWWDR